MGLYVDGYVLPIKTSKLAAYKKMAAAACKVWRDHGALEYYECFGDDLKVQGMRSFHEAGKSKAGETVVFSWIIYRSKAHRNKVNAAVMKDPRIAAMIDLGKSILDCKRMAYGGFKVAVTGGSARKV